MIFEKPQFPLKVKYSDGSVVRVENEIEAARNLEWLDTENTEDPVEVIDRLGRQVTLVIEFLEIKELRLL